jgi:hypothetical protein
MNYKNKLGYLPLEIGSIIQDYARPIIPNLQTRKNWKKGSKGLLELKKHPKWNNILEELRILSLEENRGKVLILKTVSLRIYIKIKEDEERKVVWKKK